MASQGATLQNYNNELVKCVPPHARRQLSEALTRAAPHARRPSPLRPRALRRRLRQQRGQLRRE